MFIIILIAPLISLISGYCETEDTLSVKHYYELGCKPVQDISGRIQRFVCPDFELFDKEKCHYHGNVYNQHDFIEAEYIGTCEGGCFCGGYDKSDNTPSHFYCMRHYCEEYDNTYSEGCIFQRSSPNNCCAQNIICDDEEKLKHLHKCKFNNRTYHEGEYVYPSNQCETYKCICDKHFDEFTDQSLNPKCIIKEKCDLELRFLDQYQMGCAPVYFGKYPTCPGQQYRCPTQNDRVITGSTNSDVNGENVCIFGQLILRKGDKLDDNCYNCTCVVPPMLFCRQSNANYC